MVKTEALNPGIAGLGRRRFNFPWCTGYSPNIYRKGIYLLIHKDPNDFRPHRILPIILFDIEANTHNKSLGKYAMNHAEELEVIAPGKYGSRKSKASDVQALNTCLLYNLVRQKKFTSTSAFTDLISNYDLVLHIIASLALQIVNSPKEPTHCTYITL